MKIVGLEEHLVTDPVRDAWEALPVERQDIALRQSSNPDVERRLGELGEKRMKEMDEIGLDVQVLSLTTPGLQSLEAKEAVHLATDTNDRIADAISKYPDRLQGFATLPTPAPDKAAAELERSVNKLGLKGAMLCGRTRERNLDHADFLPIFEAAVALKVPLYIHPQSPVIPVRKAYYSDLGDNLDSHLATGGIGWHYETGIQALRLVLSGVFDRLPDLQIILGHWGEVVLFYLDRIDTLNGVSGLKRPVHEYFQNNVYVTPSGILSQRYLGWAKEVVGIDRIMFATDFPYRYAPKQGARHFLEQSDLSEVDKAKVAHGNWERLTGN